jgi:hypothetical protein
MDVARWRLGDDRVPAQPSPARLQSPATRTKTEERHQVFVRHVASSVFAHYRQLIALRSMAFFLQKRESSVDLLSPFCITEVVMPRIVYESMGFNFEIFTTPYHSEKIKSFLTSCRGQKVFASPLFRLGR